MSTVTSNLTVHLPRLVKKPDWWSQTRRQDMGTSSVTPLWTFTCLDSTARTLRKGSKKKKRATKTFFFHSLSPSVSLLFILSVFAQLLLVCLWWAQKWVGQRMDAKDIKSYLSEMPWSEVPGTVTAVRGWERWKECAGGSTNGTIYAAWSLRVDVTASGNGAGWAHNLSSHSV